MKPIVLFSLTNGWGIRNFVQTGLLDQVSEFADVQVATSPQLFDFYQELLEEGRISKLFLVPEEESGFWKLIRRIKKGILQAKHQISTAKIKSAVKSRYHLERLCRGLGWSFAGVVSGNWQIEFIQSFESCFKVSSWSVVELPKVLVNCEPFDNRDNQLQRMMTKKGISTISIIPSWDNPSTKGCILSNASAILVWGPHQKQELMGFYPTILSDNIRISGIPQFDAYASYLTEKISRNDFLRGLGIDAEKRVILYATCSERLFPGEDKIVGDIVDAMIDGRIDSRAHLLIRCHPADRSSRYDRFLDSERITIFPSSLGESNNLSEWVPASSELDMLAATLRHSDLCINTASTMILDAFASGIPVINIGYENDNLDYLESPLRYYDYHHLVPIVSSGAVPVVKSASELIEEINNVFGNTDFRRVEREYVVNNFCPSPQQGSVSFIVNEIKNFC